MTDPDPKFADVDVWGHYDSTAQRSVRSQGEKNRNSIYTTEQVREIKRALAQGKTPRELTSMFGMSASYIRDIRRGLRWGHVTLDP